MSAKREPMHGWEFTNHISRCCFARVLVREAFDMRKTYRCSNCDLEAEGRSEAAICTCGIKLKTGVDAGIRCVVAESPSPEFPARITATQAVIQGKA